MRSSLLLLNIRYLQKIYPKKIIKRKLITHKILIMIKSVKIIQKLDKQKRNYNSERNHQILYKMESL